MSICEACNTHKIIIDNQSKEIDLLKVQVESITKSVSSIKYDMMMLNSQFEISSHINKVLQKQVNNLQQYSRRYSIILDNVKVRANESSQSVESEVKDILINKFSVDESQLATEFDKAHRVGSVNEENSQPIIIRFKSHSFRSNLYTERKTHQGKKENSFKLRVALSVQRRKLLDEVLKKVSGHDGIAFAYASVNGMVKVRLNNKLKNRQVFDIESSEEIDNLLIRMHNTDADAAFDEIFYSNYDM